jgi:N-acetylneuraminic acid mutarotase
MKGFFGVLFISLCAATIGKAQEGEWRELAHMPDGRQELATAVLNGKVYAIGGLDETQPVGQATNTVNVYNPATNTWAPAAPLPIVNQHNAAATAAGKLYAFAGQSRFTYVYDPANDSWTQVATMPLGQALTPAAGVINDKIYVAGGSPTGQLLQIYDPATDTWSTGASMSVQRHHCAGGVINGKFYVASGRGPGARTALEVYDPQTNNWTRLADSGIVRSGIAAAAVNGQLYIFGGEEGGVHNEVEVYNPATNSWRRIQPDWPIPRHGIWASIIGNKIYIPGGGVLENYAPTTYTHVFIVNSPTTFANISTRMKVETGDNALIGGFIVTGTGTKRIVLRAIGPSVPLAGTLANPTLELYNGAGQLVATNDNWGDAPNKQEIIDSSLAPTNPLESAILTTVAPGSHTAIVRGASGETGVGLAEVYDLEAGSDSRLANIATRGFVQTDPNILIGGLIVDGQIPRKTVVRAIGPSLGRQDALADPVLELRDANGGLLDSNDNWATSPQASEIAAAGLAPSHPMESAVSRTLSPASYTAIIRGQNASTGLAVVEAYALD